MKNPFHPIYSVIIQVVAYSLLGALFFLALGESRVLTAVSFAGVALIALYLFHLKKYDSTTRSQHLAFIVAGLSIVLLLLLVYGLAMKRSGFFLPMLALASLPPFYHFCGYVRFTQVDENTSLLREVFGIMLAPFLAFLIYNHYHGSNYKTLYLIVIVAAYTFVLYSLVRMTALVINGKKSVRAFLQTERAEKLVTALLSLVMPLTGLLLNQYMYSYTSQYARQTGYAFYYESRANEGFFGDFSHPIFYALTLVNGLALLAPMLKYDKLRLPLFYLRALGYSWIVYMFIVFLPVLPVGVLTLFFIVGIYAFVPLMLAVRQGKILRADYRLLRSAYKKKWVVGVFLLGFLTLPVMLASAFVYDKTNFDKALAYIAPFNTDASQTVNLTALRRSLDSKNANTYRQRLYGSGVRPYYSYRNIPIVSGLYNLYLYGGQELNWQSRDMLEAMFFDGYYYNAIDAQTDLSMLDYYTQGNELVQLSDISTTTRYDESIGAHRTWVELSLKNAMSEKNEYVTWFNLPDGVYVSDYYLYVGDEKKTGLLTDRRAALAIYKRIVLRQLDPGVLHYLDEHTLELRVFPFVPYEQRRTGFELIHHNSFRLSIDGHEVEIDTGEPISELRLPNAVLLNRDEIQSLPPLDREFSYHFIMDCSESGDTNGFSWLIKNYCDRYGIDDGTLYLTTYRFEKHPLADVTKLDIRQEGGFNMNLAVRDIFKNATGDRIPIIIFVTNKNDEGILLPQQINSYASPESEFYYRLDSDLLLTPFSFYSGYRLYPTEQPVIQDVVSYNGHAVINDGEDKLVLLDETIQEPTGNQYLDALALAAENRVHLKNGARNPLSYIRKSLLAHVLTPATAFIVVETAEQEADLLKLQEQILKQQESDGVGQLSEPPVVVVLVLAGLLALAVRIGGKRRCL